MSDDPYFLIRRSHLPEVIQKTAQVTELLRQDPELSVLEAVHHVGLSRSAYYKYKDVVKPFHAAVSGHIVTLALTLSHERGVLSEVLNLLANLQANILTINQSLPLQGRATVIISIETRDLTSALDDVLEALLSEDGVHQALVVGQG
ncbi:MAG: ACT domain-containing protein [Firmicutes bacterium]|nr:ACT domain-containing protein [Bacillota bacterium]